MRRTTIVTAIAAAVSVAGCSRPSGLGARPASAAERADPHAADGARNAGSWSDHTYSNAAGSRRYKLYVPGAYDTSRRHTLVVLLHGCTQDADDIARGTRIAAHAERDGFLVLIPEQPESANPKKCWNWYDPAHQSRDGGEPSIIAGMTDEVARTHAVDPARVHLAGISAGAGMASLVAVAYPERYASLALHSGLAWRAATDVMGALGVMAKGVPDAAAQGAAAFEAMGSRGRAIPTLVVYGGKDAVVNRVNGSQSAAQWAATAARALGVPSLATRQTRGQDGGYGWTRTCHSGATGTCVVEELEVHELGHAWSGGSREGTFTDERGPEATREMVRFFREHPFATQR